MSQSGIEGLVLVLVSECFGVEGQTYLSCQTYSLPVSAAQRYQSASQPVHQSCPAQPPLSALHPR